MRKDIRAERATSERDAEGMHEYRICCDRATTLGLVTAPDAKAAERIWYQTTIARLRADIERMTPTAALGPVGAALRSGGIAPIPEGDSRPYINAARELGYQARTHRVDAERYLLVAADWDGIERLKGDLDQSAAVAANA